MQTNQSINQLNNKCFIFCPPECIIKSLINPRNISKMESTFGTWMKDTAVLNDKRIWVAEHFSGTSQTHTTANQMSLAFLWYQPNAGNSQSHYL